MSTPMSVTWRRRLNRQRGGGEKEEEEESRYKVGEECLTRRVYAKSGYSQLQLQSVSAGRTADWPIVVSSPPSERDSECITKGRSAAATRRTEVESHVEVVSVATVYEVFPDSLNIVTSWKDNLQLRKSRILCLLQLFIHLVSLLPMWEELQLQNSRQNFIDKTP